MSHACMKDVKGMNVLVVGLGKSGFAAARLALAKGATVTLYDDKAAGAFDATAMKALFDQGAHDACGIAEGQRDAVFTSSDLLVVSPGFPMARREIAAAKAAGIPVIGEVEFASRFLPAESVAIGITGTNGKSTVTALTGALCAATGKETFAGGNLGFPLSDAVLSGKRYAYVVVELSSFMLEGIDTFHPRVAAFTNLTPDHIDRYESHEAYGRTKKRIFMNQTEGDAAVANASDRDVMRLSSGERCRVYSFGFGDAADDAARFQDGVIRVRMGGKDESYRLDNINLRGPHNAENAMAAVLCARLAGVDQTSVQKGLDGYPGLHHRMESVGFIGSVEFINDSKATNVDSTLVALKSFDHGLLLIAGGRGKGLPYKPLVDLAPGRIRAVFTIGEDAPKVRDAFQGTIPVMDCGDLETAMRRAFDMARGDDKVLLSPACASYDQFRNFEVRGEVFGEIYRRMKAEEDARSASVAAEGER